MSKSGSERRNSRALEAPLIADPKARAAAEARNGFRQYDAGIKTVQTALERGVFKLRLSLILALHREALDEQRRGALGQRDGRRLPYPLQRQAGTCSKSRTFRIAGVGALHTNSSHSRATAGSVWLADLRPLRRTTACGTQDHSED